MIAAYFLSTLLIMRMAQKKEVSLRSFLRTLAISLMLGPIAGIVAAMASSRFTRYKGAERVQKELEYKMVKLIKRIEKQYKKLDNSQNEGRQNKLEKRLEELNNKLYDYAARYTAAGGKFFEIQYLSKQRTSLENKMDEIAHKIENLQGKIHSGDLSVRETDKIRIKIADLNERYKAYHTQYARLNNLSKKNQDRKSTKYLEPLPDKQTPDSQKARRAQARANYQSIQQNSGQNISKSNGIKR